MTLMVRSETVTVLIGFRYDTLQWGRDCIRCWRCTIAIVSVILGLCDKPLWKNGFWLDPKALRSRILGIDPLRNKIWKSIFRSENFVIPNFVSFEIPNFDKLFHKFPSFKKKNQIIIKTRECWQKKFEFSKIISLSQNIHLSKHTLKKFFKKRKKTPEWKRKKHVLLIWKHNYTCEGCGNLLRRLES
jgi:hypothetical protein